MSRPYSRARCTDTGSGAWRLFQPNTPLDLLSRLVFTVPAMPPPGIRAGRDRLRIAIQQSGRRGEPARALLAACGLSWRESRDRLFCHGESLPVDLLLVRDDDIPGLIAAGACDLGIVGRNVLLEQAAASPGQYREWRALGFGGCRLDI